MPGPIIDSSFKADLLEKVDDIVVVTDREGMVLYANAAACSCMGVAGPDGGCILETGKPLPGLGHARGKKGLAGAIRRLRRGSVTRAKIECARPDGTSVPVEIRIRLLESPGYECVLILGRDVSVREALAERHRESEDWQLSLFDSSPDLVSLTDFDLRISYVSPSHSRVFGFPPEHFIGKRASELMYKDDRWRVETRLVKYLGENVRNFLKKGRFVHSDTIEWRMDDRWGQCHLLETSATITRKGVVCISRDITARRKMEIEARKARNLESIGMLAGGIAHDLNNLLTVMKGNLSLAAADLQPGSAPTERLAKVETAVEAAARLADQLLTFSRGGAPVRKAADLAAIVEQAVGFTLSGSSVTTEISFPDGLWKVDVDEGQFRQVVQNLVLNAVQAMPDGGRITVRADNLSEDMAEALDLRRMRHVMISFEDTGKGIPPENLEKIFDPYFTTRDEGHGLGLAIAFSIVRGHDGHIKVESKPGEGTTFRIYLPAARKLAPEEAPQRRSQARRKGKECLPARVLVMEDESAVAEATRMMLLRMGCEAVDVAAHGKAAIERYEGAMNAGAPFDMVLMDMTIPGGMGGEQAIAKLLEIDPAACVVVTTGYAASPALAGPEQLGFRGAIGKPYSLRELETAVREAMVKAGSR